MKEVLKTIIDGTILTNKSVMKQIPFIIFLVGLALVSITNRNYSERKINDVSDLRQEVRELRANSITIASELMEISKQTTIFEEVKKRGINLQEAKAPPMKIIIDDKHKNNNQ